VSEREPRAELADVARSLARVIQRERPDAELLLQSAARARREVASARPVASPAAEPRTTATRARTADAAEPTPPAVADAAGGSPSTEDTRDLDVAPPIVDLFGVSEKTRPAYEPLDFTKLPSHHDPLNPIAAAERESIQLVSLPILNEVAGEVRGCRKCGLCETRTLAVPGVGSASSGIVFVGEAPGADEDAQGEPFVGRAGKLLTEIIKGMDERQLIPGISLTRETVYICNVLKCRPPENRNPLPHEIEACSPYLDRQLEALKPRIICCLGKFAAELLVGVKGTIRDMRGKVYRYKGARLIVTYHPAAILRSPHQYRRPVWEDMQFLAREYLSE